MEKVLLKRYHLNSQTVRFHPQTPNLELQVQLIPLVLARCVLLKVHLRATVPYQMKI